MKNETKLFIDGQWVDPIAPQFMDVINPATETVFAQIALGGAADVDAAVAAAERAFPSYSLTSVEERIAFFERCCAIFHRRADEMAQVISDEMGAPINFSIELQVGTCFHHFKAIVDILRSYEFNTVRGTTMVAREAIGVVGLITPWNWPINTIINKVLPALASGCTIVLKPSEIAPLDAVLLAEIFEEAGLPKGVFNLVHGEGSVVGEAIAAHPRIDMVSFTGSSRAGIRVAQLAAATVKRVTQELGGKSANIILDDADLAEAVRGGIDACFSNSGQSCDAPTRLLVSKQRYAEALSIAVQHASTITVGDPASPKTTLGPVVSEAQFDKIQMLIRIGLDEGASAIVGGLGRPEGHETGYFVRPTIFSSVNPEMTIAKEEIFGPVLCIMAYENEEEAIYIANDTPYGLAAYVQSEDVAHARHVASKLRAGTVYIKYPPFDPMAPFGGYKQSGNGRESGLEALSEYLEIKSMVGWHS